jgi:short-subunit dehydrogenase
VVVADFSEGNELKIYDEIYAKVKDLDISILINNAGLNYRGEFNKVASAQLLEMTIVNTYPYVLLTKKLLDKLTKRDNAKRSALINVSSGLGMYPAPYDGVYSATKAFERFWSEALNFEAKYEKLPLDVLTVHPGYVATNNARLETSLLVVSPDYFC